jgi:UTP--glucose-1-phosphate uridylyltransferase
MIALARTQPFYGLKFDGRSFECGLKIGFLAADASYALAREDIAPGFRAEVKKMLAEINGAS